ncbi:hypothetical protein IAR55_003690 [Kwoniella newhampshirensis]|uniref:Uncharacterized protein n=1 Tax=Kwoniella newhampshirensis TaxID=1651941 RepID=A0AAW0YZQ1_9TREE
MGQTQGKLESEFSPQHRHRTPSSSSPGTKDPFHRPTLSKHYRAPHSAPVLPTKKSSTAVGIFRSLSQKRAEDDPPPRVKSSRPNDKVSKQSAGMDLADAFKTFEALVVKAETEAGVFSDEIKTTYRPTDHSIPRPLPPYPPPNLVSSFQQRTSTSSIQSPSRGSVKSARRAEREWLAKVAALSSGMNPRHSDTNSDKVTTPHPYRGPVPPRRQRPATSARQSNSSPSTEDETSLVLITPPPSSTENGRTLMSSISFETLGHHVRLVSNTSSTRLVQGNGRGIKPSVPRSAISSFYADGGNGTGSRPNSFAASMVLLSTIPLDEDTDRSPSVILSSSSDVGPVNCPSSLIESEGRPDEKGERDDDHVDLGKEQEIGRKAGGEVKIRMNQIATALNEPNLEPSVTANAPQRSSESSSVEPIPHTPTRSSAKPTIKPLMSYSPTTEYILSAPSIEHLAWSGDSLLFDPSTPTIEAGKHPFASIGVQCSPELPSPPSKSHDQVDLISPSTSLANDVTPTIACPRDIILPSNMRTHDEIKKKTKPFPRAQDSYPSNNNLLSFTALKSRSINISTSSLSHTQRSASASARSKQHDSSKVDIVGRKGDKSRPTPISKRMRGIDLTPGQEEGGSRPPKSGIPRSELERWLAGTATAME